MGSTADMNKPKLRSVVVYCGSKIGIKDQLNFHVEISCTLRKVIFFVFYNISNNSTNL